MIGGLVNDHGTFIEEDCAGGCCSHQEETCQAQCAGQDIDFGEEGRFIIQAWSFGEQEGRFGDGHRGSPPDEGPPEEHRQ